MENSVRLEVFQKNKIRRIRKTLAVKKVDRQGFVFLVILLKLHIRLL